MVDLFRSVVLWSFGGTLYFMAEVIWKTARGNPESISWTMLVLAGIVCIPLDLINERLEWDVPLWLQAVIGGLGITAVEFMVGIILNLWLGFGVWDYSHLKFNLWGQISLSWSMLWVVVAGGGIVLLDWSRHWLYHERKPTYKMK